MKLYKVTCRGLTHSMGVNYGIAYVVANNPAEAYAKVKIALDARDVGFPKDREMDKVELLAECCDYPACGTMLYL